MLYVLGHIGLMVPDVNAACERFEKYNVEWVKRPNDGTIFSVIVDGLRFSGIRARFIINWTCNNSKSQFLT